MDDVERERPDETEPVLDREALVAGLQELGIDIELSDWEGEDDNDVLGHIATYSLMYDLDIDDVRDALGIDLVQPDELE